MKDHTIILNDYEVANLRAAIQAACCLTEGQIKSPLMVLYSGDWIGQVYKKLPKVDFPPNVGPVELAESANSWKM